jgi:hypothetical protein
MQERRVAIIRSEDKPQDPRSKRRNGYEICSVSFDQTNENTNSQCDQWTSYEQSCEAEGGTFHRPSKHDLCAKDR